MVKSFVYVEDIYLVFKIPFSKIVEHKELLNLLEILKAEELKKKINICEREFERLTKEFDEMLRNRLKEWFKEAGIEMKWDW